MRVIGGAAGGMRLEAPEGMDLRPIPDMARQALFNILGDELAGARFLDLFAGAGTVGIEALSRGAALCRFVEKSARHAGFIKRNLEHTHLAGAGEVIIGDAFRVPETLRRSGAEFDIIFLGPPFPLWVDPRAKSQLLALIDRLAESGLLSALGVAIAQHDVKDILPEETPHLRRSDMRTYGRNVLSFYRRRPIQKAEPQ